MLAWGENAPNRADTMPRPRAAMCPDPSRSSSLPVGKRTSPSTANVVRSVWVTLSLTRAAMSPMAVADPSTNREVESCGLAGVPPKKCCAVAPPKGKICASLVPRSDVETIGSTTPMSTRSISPKLMKKDVTVMSMSSARRNPITSFSCVGTPYGAHEAPTRLSHELPVTFSWVKVISMPLRLTPRSVSRCRRLTLAPTNTRPRPSVWARSLNTEPGERDVGTGTPPSKRNVEPPLVALTGRFATFWLIAVPMNEIRVPLSDTAEGTKWSACSAVAESEPAVPPRNSGSLPSATMNGWEIASRRHCASSGSLQQRVGQSDVEPRVMKVDVSLPLLDSGADVLLRAVRVSSQGKPHGPRARYDATPVVRMRPQVIPDHGERRVPPPEVQQQERHLIVPVRRVGLGG